MERQSHYGPELQWLRGLEIVNHHSLSEFRARNTDRLEAIFSQAPALLSEEGLIDPAQVTVDGTRVRAQASTSSERRRPTRKKRSWRELTATASDAQQLEPTPADVGRRLEQRPQQVVADKGYNSRANIAAMKAAGIDAGYASKFLLYDQATDRYRCPSGARGVERRKTR